MKSPHARLSEHIEDLRQALFKSLVILLISWACVGYFYEQVTFFLLSPLNRPDISIEEVHTQKITNRSSKPILYKGHEIAPKSSIKVDYLPPSTLNFFSPAEGFIAIFKTTLWVAFVLTSPLWLLPLIAFILPALYESEKSVVIPFYILSFVFISLGLALAFFVTLPLTNSYFLDLNQSLGNNFWNFQAYIDYSLNLLGAHAIGFELLAALLLLIHLKMITYPWLSAKRRYAVVIALVLGAVLTPPDVLSQLLLAGPLYLLYEMAVLYSKMIYHSVRYTV